jgi:hypothetical protein
MLHLQKVALDIQKARKEKLQAARWETKQMSKDLKPLYLPVTQYGEAIGILAREGINGFSSRHCLQKEDREGQLHSCRLQPDHKGTCEMVPYYDV